MGAAMQRAGFTDLSVEAWSYGCGFPKSMNIGKALDKRGGNAHLTTEAGAAIKAAPASDAARTWEGWGTALKPSWEPVLVGRKPHAP
jgi:site-specific DNA-methyltransferase (adenine-specific)